MGWDADLMKVLACEDLGRSFVKVSQEERVSPARHHACYAVVASLGVSAAAENWKQFSSGGGGGAILL